jgi:hypothetical protein
MEKKSGRSTTTADVQRVVHWLGADLVTYKCYMYLLTDIFCVLRGVQSVVQLEGLLRVLRNLEKNLPAAPQVAKFSKFAIHRTIDHSGGTRSFRLLHVAVHYKFGSSYRRPYRPP